MKKTSLIIIALLYFTPLLHAQQGQDTLKHTDVSKDTIKRNVSAELKSDIPALSDAEYNAWLKGSDLKTNLTLVAEINNYPTPEKVLKLKKQLDLSPVQINQLNEVMKYLKLKKVEAGGDFIRNERTIDSLFRTKKINEPAIIFYGNRYGLYLGEYRTSLLIACKRTSQILTARQLSKYVQLQNRN